MSTRLDLDRSIGAWLVAEAPERAPERLLEVSRDHIRRTRQRRPAWPTWRIPEMNTYAKLVIATAAVVAVAIVGLNVMAGSALRVDGPVATPSARPTPTRSWLALPPSGQLEPGEYLVQSMDVPPLVVTVPDGWASGSAARGYAISKDKSGLLVTFWTVRDVYADPCGPLTRDPAPGPSVDDLANALADITWADTTRPVAVDLGGYPGKYLELTLRDELGCDPFLLWSNGTGGNRWAQGPGQHFRLWVLQVGRQRALIDADWLPGASSTELAELSQVVESIRFE